MLAKRVPVIARQRKQPRFADVNDVRMTLALATVEHVVLDGRYWGGPVRLPLARPPRRQIRSYGDEAVSKEESPDGVDRRLKRYLAKPRVHYRRPGR